MTILKSDVQSATGYIQLCSGQEAGCETAVHATHEMFEDEDSHGVIQIDASNGFNNIKILSPEISTFAINCYSKPSRLFITGGKELNSSEGTTQGDPISMAMYAIGIMPLMTMVMGSMSSCIKQIAFADDLTGIGTIDQLKEWWDLIIEHGPYRGYYVNVDKSWLICKQQHFEHAEQIFADSPIGITIEGRKHLRTVIGSVEYKKKNLHENVRTWIAEVEVLGEIAKSEPHAAYTAFTHGLRHKYNYVTRTIPNISDDLKPLDDAIRNTFIKAVMVTFAMISR